MKHIKLFEEFNERLMFPSYLTLDEKIMKFLNLPKGYDSEYNDEDERLSITSGDAEIGYVHFGGIEEFDDKDYKDLEGKKYIVIEEIYFTDEHLKKELFDAIIDAALEYAKRTKKADGVISTPVDLDDEKIKRSDNESKFWNNRAKENKAVKYKTTAGDMYTIEI